MYAVGSKEESLVLKLRFQEIVFGDIARNSCILKIPSVENIDWFDFFHGVQKIVAADDTFSGIGGKEYDIQFYGPMKSVQKFDLIDQCSPYGFTDICLAVVKGMTMLIRALHRVINEKFYMILLLLLFLLCSRFYIHLTTRPVHSICHEYSYKSTDIHLHQCLQCIDLLTKKQTKVSLFCICEDVKLQNEIMKILLYFYELKWI
uniref:Uncharacterized protein n=1 Tax=Glossina pallidipes TaxID=7398 RepID=A0A1B0AHT9_GLOPL